MQQGSLKRKDANRKQAKKKSGAACGTGKPRFLFHRKVRSVKQKPLRSGSHCGGTEDAADAARRRRRIPQAGFFSKEEFHKYVKYRYLVLMFLPAVIFFILFSYVPMYGITLAFKDFKVMEGIMGSPWIGLENFKLLFGSPSFLKILSNTLIISGWKFVLNFTAPIVLALMINELRGKRFKKTVQTISYLPHFVSWVILTSIFMNFLSPSSGPINILLKELGFEPIYFLADEHWIRPVLILTSVWKSVGWGTIVYLAAIASINSELYEAAYLDGANRFQRVWHITLPGMAPTITILLILGSRSIISDDFDQIFNMVHNGGNPAAVNAAALSKAEVIATYTYKVGLKDLRYSYSTAVNLFTNVIGLFLVLITNKISKVVNEYGI